MAVYLYGEGDTAEVRGVKCELIRIDIADIDYYLERGYVKNPKDLYQAALDPDGNEPTGEIPTREEADLNNSGKLSNTEVREAAKKAGIDDWETARIKTLKDKLGYE